MIKIATKFLQELITDMSDLILVLIGFLPIATILITMLVLFSKFAFWAFKFI